MFWNQQVEMLPRADMVAWQNHKLKTVMERVYEKSLLYNRRMEEAGVQPEDITSVDDLDKLPFTTRKDISGNYPYGLLTMPISGVAYVHRKQAIDGEATAVSYTTHDMAMWTELMSRMLVAGGVNVTSVFQLAVKPEEYLDSLGVYYGAQQVGATLVSAPVSSAVSHISVIEEFGINTVFSTPSYMLALGQEMRQAQQNPEELPLQIIFCDRQALTESIRSQIEQEYRAKVLGIYGLDDIFGMGIAGECDCADGLHIQEDCFYPEIVDAVSGQVLPVGQVGELVLTSLVLEAMPLIRYRTGLLGYLDYTPCACGRTLVRMKKSL